jgi:hypothetical protein
LGWRKTSIQVVRYTSHNLHILKCSSHHLDIQPDDYDQRYPPDEFGQEMGPNARVWRVYLDEAELNDHDMVEGWKDGIDVLLVFVRLAFSWLIMHTLK